ncbi:MAG: tetratricopeptide repeat protein [Bacteroidales bacterium]|jgi:tetratricopeptide (TPR) repeat protein|nr:tetratricopeptide repeat protein [Bacteroidales bacterium]MDD4394571.1 tetratricopeptide repeat protein [Bacteroidales bacterium]
MKKTFLLALCFLTLVACHHKEEKKDSVPVVDTVPTTLYNSLEIRSLYHHADSLLNIGKADTVLMNQYVNLALRHVEKNPEDTLAADFVFYAGIFQMKVAAMTPPSRKQERLSFCAIEIFNQVAEDYPDYTNIDYCYYYKGNIFENLKRFTDAENEYRELVHRFPNSELAKGIAAYLEVQGFTKTPDELMSDIKKKN